MNLKLFFITVLVCGCCVAAAEPCSAQTTSKTLSKSTHGALLEWARGKAIVLDTIEPGSGTSDLEALHQLVGDARIVLLGDSRHDAREQWLLKHRLIEYLVKRMDFSVLAMEESLAGTAPLNACLLGEREDLDKALSEMGAWYLWDTEELLALMSSLRDHNEETTPNLGGACLWLRRLRWSTTRRRERSCLPRPGGCRLCRAVEAYHQPRLV